MGIPRNEHSDASEWDHWIDTIKDQGVNLTIWEEEFIEHMDDLRGSGRTLTEKQSRIVERIYADRTPQ